MIRARRWAAAILPDFFTDSELIAEDTKSRQRDAEQKPGDDESKEELEEAGAASHGSV